MTNRISARRLIGTALVVTGMALAGVVALGFTPSSAAPAKQQCHQWGMYDMSVVPAGPGAVKVGGVAVATKIDASSHCRRGVEVVGYKLDGTELSAQLVTGPAYPFWDSGDKFTQQLRIPVGTEAVCVRTELGTHIGCYEVEVPADENGAPATPIVGDLIEFGKPPYHEGDGPIDLCGHCV